jgi:hypothetical protein
MVDLSKVRTQVEYILFEHAECDKFCPSIGVTNKYDHKRAIASMIAYYVLGLSNG